MKESEIFDRLWKRFVLVFYLLLGDVSLDKLLQNPGVVDVSATTGTQRPISLEVANNPHILCWNCFKLNTIQMQSSIFAYTIPTLSFYMKFSGMNKRVHLKSGMHISVLFICIVQFNSTFKHEESSTINPDVSIGGVICGCLLLHKASRSQSINTMQKWLNGELWTEQWANWVTIVASGIFTLCSVECWVGRGEIR